MPTRTQIPRASTALLLIDVINPFDFPRGATVARRALPMARHLQRLRERATRAGVPVIYVNDNLGRWRSNVDELVQWCGAGGRPGAPLIDLLKPQPNDLVVLKATLSGFYQTPLEALLRLAGVRTLLLTGLLADNCVLFTAADAYMRDYRLVVPRDCVVGKTPAATQRALAMMRELFDVRTTPSRTVRLSRR